MAPLVPANPEQVTVIRKVTENITTFSAPFARFGLMKIGGRGTLVRLPSGALAVFSPTALTPDVRSHIESLGGQLKFISALDYEHHIFMGDWAKAYPGATLIGLEGLAEKRKKQGNPLKFDQVFTAKERVVSVDEEFDSEFDVEYVPAHTNKELVFNFKREGTLIQGDLMFNLPATEQYSKSPEDPQKGILSKIFNYTNNTQGSNPFQRKFLWYLASAQDRPDFNRSVAKIDKWDFDRIVPCHGDVIESGGKEVFRKLFAWHLGQKEIAGKTI